jgi:hypothetical protein
LMFGGSLARLLRLERGTPPACSEGKAISDGDVCGCYPEVPSVVLAARLPWSVVPITMGPLG